MRVVDSLKAIALIRLLTLLGNSWFDRGMEVTPFRNATADDVRSADKAEVLPSLATIRKAIQRLTDRLIVEGMF